MPEVRKTLLAIAGTVLGIVTIRRLRKRRATTDETEPTAETEHDGAETAAEHAKAAAEHARLAAEKATEK